MKISELIAEHQLHSNHNCNYLKYTDEEINLDCCPRCKSDAELHFISKSDPPCHYMAAYIRCTRCEIRTSERCIDGYYGDTSTINDVINDWNK